MAMAEPGSRQAFQVQGGQLLEKVRELIHEGNVRRIVIKQGDHAVVEFPLTVGAVAVLVAPWLAVVGALAAFVTDWTVEVERAQPSDEAGTRVFDAVPPAVHGPVAQP
jgi:hypothetical protein